MTTPAKKPRQFKLHLADEEYTAIMENLTPERRAEALLAEARRISGSQGLLKISVPIEQLRKSILLHAEDGQGLKPIIENGSDLINWSRVVILQLAGYEEDDSPIIKITLDQESGSAIIAATHEIIQKIRNSIL